MIRHQALLAAALLAAPFAAWAAKPNIIVITTDDQGYADLTAQGSREIPTPHLDSIAYQGVRATNAYVTAPLCGPSRAAFITGRYQQRFGLDGNPGKRGIPTEEVRLPQVLKTAGYATGIIGKWHQGTDPEYLPNSVGFDYFFGTPVWGHFFLPPTRETVEAGGDLWMRSWADGREDTRTASPTFANSYNNIYRNGDRVSVSGYLTDEFTKEAVKFVDDNKDKPFFLHLSYNAPHTPVEAPQKYLDRFAYLSDAEQRRTYAAMVSAVDDGVGKVIRQLKEHGIYDNTLIIFFSDNGGASYSDNPEQIADLVIRGSRQEKDYLERFGDNSLRWGRAFETRIAANGADNGELRAGKGTLFEGGIRVPFFVKWPTKIPKGQVLDATISTLDIFPTVLAAAEVAPPDGVELDGQNVLPVLTGEKKPDSRGPLFWRYSGQAAVRDGSYKWVRFPSGVEHLYDVANDIGETRNLAPSQPDLVASLRARWEEWNKTMPAPPGPPTGSAPERRTGNEAAPNLARTAGGS